MLITKSKTMKKEQSFKSLKTYSKYEQKKREKKIVLLAKKKKKMK